MLPLLPLLPLLALLAGCGATAHQIRALDIADALSAAVCDTVIGASGNGAQVHELEVEVGLTTAAHAEAGVDIEVLAVTAEASVELASTVTVHFEGGDLPSYERCLEIRQRPVESYILNVVDGAATIERGPADSTTGGPASPSSDTETASGSLVGQARVQRGRVPPGACRVGTVDTLNPDATPQNRARCVDSYESGAVVRLLGRSGTQVRWRITAPYATECACTAASAQPEGTGDESPVSNGSS